LRKICCGFLIGARAVLASAPGTQGGMDDPHGQHLVPMNWWESAASI
jgi:hypothetical protein